MSQKASTRSLAEAVGEFEADRRQLIETLRGELEKFGRYYRPPDPAASELRSRLSREIQRAYPAQFKAYLERADLEPPVRHLTIRDLLREQLDNGLKPSGKWGLAGEETVELFNGYLVNGSLLKLRVRPPPTPPVPAESLPLTAGSPREPPRIFLYPHHRGPPPLWPDEKASLYRVRQITVRDVLREQLDMGMKLSVDMSRELGLTDAELSREVGPTAESDLAKRAQFAHPASWKALPRREREAARLFARRVEKHGPGVGAGRPRYAGETTVFEVAFAIRDALAASGHRLSDRRLIPFNKAGSSLKGQPVSLLRAAVLAALPVSGLPSDRYLEDLLTRHR